jgi:DNA replication protein DnaD
VNALQGWVSIHRKIMNNPVWQDPKLLKLWMLCLLEASHKEHEQLVGRKIVKLQPGQFITGRFSLAKTYNEGSKKANKVEERTLWRWMKMLEEYDFLSINSNTKFSVITIKNWNQYQQNVQPMSNKCPADVQPMSTNNNGNNDNKIYKDDDNQMQPNYFTEYEKAFGYPPALLISDFEYWIDNENSQFADPEEIIIEVIHRAKKQMPRNPAKYVSKILKDLHDMELYTIEAVKAYNKKFDEKFANGGAADGKKVSQHRRSNGRPASKSTEQAIREAEEARKAWGG